MILFYLWTRREPFEQELDEGYNAFQLMVAVLQGKRPAITPDDDMPNELLLLVHACWDGEPSKRPSAAECADSLTLLQVRPTGIPGSIKPHVKGLRGIQ
jgi:hypothetical protein